MTASVTDTMYSKSITHIVEKGELAMKRHEQMNIFTRKIKSAFLVANNSPRHAFYRIWIESDFENFKIVKESGAKGRVLDKRSWPAGSLEEAQKFFNRRVESKTNEGRKNPRKYKIVFSE